MIILAKIQIGAFEEMGDGTTKNYLYQGWTDDVLSRLVIAKLILHSLMHNIPKGMS